MNYESQITNKFLKISIFCIILYSFCMIPVADAARLYFERSDNVIYEGDMFEVTLLIDTEAESINAVEGNIYFSDNLELQNINDGGSLLTLWIKKPIVKDKNIIFSGIVPGGYLGELSPYWEGYNPGKILTLRFKATTSGLLWLKISDITVLLNDGKGTQTLPSIENMQFNVTDKKRNNINLKEVNLYNDNEPPEKFIPQIARDENIFNGKYFLIFETQDKGSGISFYEVKEGKRKFIKVESPYLLKDQSLESFIQIKAVDRLGNTRIVNLNATYPPSVFKNYIFWFIIILIVIIIWRRKKKK